MDTILKEEAVYRRERLAPVTRVHKKVEKVHREEKSKAVSIVWRVWTTFISAMGIWIVLSMLDVIINNASPLTVNNVSSYNIIKLLLEIVA